MSERTPCCVGFLEAVCKLRPADGSVLKPLLVIAIAVVSISSASHGGTVLHVDDDASAGGDGRSWITAFRFLQDALDEAAGSGGAVSEILVAEGTYVPDRYETNPDGQVLGSWGPCN